jgi:hypothetical protein
VRPQRQNALDLLARAIYPIVDMGSNPLIGTTLILAGAVSWTQYASADELGPGVTCENTSETAFQIIKKHFDFQIGRNIPNVLSKGAALTLKHGDYKVLCKIVYDIFDRDKKFVGRGEVPYTAIETHSSSGIDVSVYRSESEMIKSPERKKGEQLHECFSASSLAVSCPFSSLAVSCPFDRDFACLHHTNQRRQIRR